MQLNQIIFFDNKTTSTTVYPTGDNVSALTCAEVTEGGDTLESAKLIAMDGHIWSTEMNGMQCNRIKTAIEGISGSTAQATAITKLKEWYGKEPAVRGLLPSEFQDVVCNPFESLTTYLTDLAANTAKLSDTDNNTNTKAITDADNSTKALMTAAGCPTS